MITWWVSPVHSASQVGEGMSMPYYTDTLLARSAAKPFLLLFLVLYHTVHPYFSFAHFLSFSFQEILNGPQPSILHTLLSSQLKLSCIRVNGDVQRTIRDYQQSNVYLSTLCLLHEYEDSPLFTWRTLNDDYPICVTSFSELVCGPMTTIIRCRSHRYWSRYQLPFSPAKLITGVGDIQSRFDLANRCWLGAGSRSF